MPRTRSVSRVLIGRYAVALVAALALVAGAVVATNALIDDKLSSIRRVPVAVAPDTGSDEPANFLVIGSDSRAAGANSSDPGAFGDPSVETGQRSDTLMVVRVDPKHQTAYVVSFPRDLRTNIPGVGTSKINAAFNDGRDSVVATLKSNYGIDIHHYLQIDFDSFRGIVDSLGGIRVYFPAPASDPCSTFDLEPPRFKKPGDYKLSGDEALLYVRSRYYYQYTDGRWRIDPLYDIDRIERQQDFIRRMAAEAIKTSIANPITGSDVSDKAISKLQIDRDLTRDDINKLVNAFRHVNPDDTSSLQMTTIPWANDPQGSSDLLLDLSTAGPVLAALRGDGPIPFPAAPDPPADPGAPATPGSDAPVPSASVTNVPPPPTPKQAGCE